MTNQRLRHDIDLMRRLADYQQKKKLKKMEELKKKKPPFKVGTYKLESAGPPPSTKGNPRVGYIFSRRDCDGPLTQIEYHFVKKES